MSNSTESMLLWVPIHPEIVEEETNDLIQKVTAANNAVLNFAEGIITLEDTFQVIEHYGANIDEYRNILDENLRVFGA